MSLEENIKKILNKVKHFDMKLGQFEKKLEELETEVTKNMKELRILNEREDIEYPIPNAAETILFISYLQGYMFGDKKPWVPEEEFFPESTEEIQEPTDQVIVEEEEEAISEEVLQEIEEVVNNDAKAS